MKANHKYRVSVYLGKENYQKLQEMADFFSVPLASIVKVMIDQGMSFAQVMEANYGKRK